MSAMDNLHPLFKDIIGAQLNGICAESNSFRETNPAERHLRSMVEWHQRNEDAVLPTALLAMLVAARKVC